MDSKAYPVSGLMFIAGDFKNALKKSELFSCYF